MNVQRFIRSESKENKFQSYLWSVPVIIFYLFVWVTFS